MSASKICKLSGLSLKKLTNISGVCPQTLINWHHNKPKLFALVVAGAANLK